MSAPLQLLWGPLQDVRVPNVFSRLVVHLDQYGRLMVYPAQHPPIINLGFAKRLWKERIQALNLSFCQPEKVADDPSPIWENES